MSDAILKKITALMEMTPERGCTEEEANTAALMIGRMVIKYRPTLSFTESTQHHYSSQHTDQIQHQNHTGYTYIGDGPVRGETEKALLIFFPPDIEEWLPKSQLYEQGEDLSIYESHPVYVSVWLVRKREWTEGQWA